MGASGLGRLGVRDIMGDCVIAMSFSGLFLSAAAIF